MGAAVSQVTGSFSSPAARNPAAAMMRAAYEGLGYDISFLNCEVSPLRIADAVAGARAMGWLGFAIGRPHTTEVVAHLDGLAESAAATGVATCATRRGDALVGENTEGWAVLECVERVLAPEGARAVVFGSGSAARAVAVELARAGAASITLVSRTAVRARQAARLLTGVEGLVVQIAEWREPFVVPATTDVVVNATPVGSSREPEARLNVDMASLRPRMLVADMVVGELETQLIKEAAATGCQTIDGTDILVGQGMLWVRLWTNADADPVLMREALLPELRRLGS